LKLDYDEALSNIAFRFNLCRYNMNETQLYRLIRAGNFNFRASPVWAKISEEAKDLIKVRRCRLTPARPRLVSG